MTVTYNYFVHTDAPHPRLIAPENVDKLFEHIEALTGIGRQMAEIILRAGNPITSGDLRITAAKSKAVVPLVRARK